MNNRWRAQAKTANEFLALLDAAESLVTTGESK